MEKHLFIFQTQALPCAGNNQGPLFKPLENAQEVDLKQLKETLLYKIPRIFRPAADNFKLTFSTKNLSNPDCYVRLGRWEFLCKSVLKALKKAVHHVAKSEDNISHTLMIAIIIAGIILTICGVAMIVCCKRNQKTKSIDLELCESTTSQL